MRPPRYRLALVNWIAIYPLITLLLWVLAPHIRRLALPAQTLVLSLILVTIMNFLVMPLMLRAFQPWLRPRVPSSPEES